MKRKALMLTMSLLLLAGCKASEIPDSPPPSPPNIIQETSETPVPEPEKLEPPEVSENELPVLDEAEIEMPVEEIVIEKVMYTTSDLNVRKGANKDSAILSVLRKGAKLTIEEVLDNGWARIEAGYVSFSYLTDNVPEVIPEDATYAPFTIYLPGKAISYQNGGVDAGQTIIDSNPALSSTWGGVNPWSGTDEKNTHFIAHDFGAFSDLWNIPVGEKLIITDSIGTPTYYQVESLYLVDKYGVDAVTGEEMFDVITGVHEEEMVTLQTCKPYSLNNYILTAKKANQ